MTAATWSPKAVLGNRRCCTSSLILVAPQQAVAVAQSSRSVQRRQWWELLRSCMWGLTSLMQLWGEILCELSISLLDISFLWMPSVLRNACQELIYFHEKDISTSCQSLLAPYLRGRVQVFQCSWFSLLPHFLLSYSLLSEETLDLPQFLYPYNGSLVGQRSVGKRPNSPWKISQKIIWKSRNGLPTAGSCLTALEALVCDTFKVSPVLRVWGRKLCHYGTVWAGYWWWTGWGKHNKTIKQFWSTCPMVVSAC